MAILDTNVLIRYLTRDDPEQSRRVLSLLQEIQSGRRTATLPEGVLVETIQVISSPRSYRIDRETIRARLLAILRLPSLHMVNKRTYYQALDLYVQYSRLSFVDALCVAHALRSSDKTVISFDRDFRNLAGLIWEQP